MLQNMSEYIKQSQSRLDDAIKLHNPIFIWIAYSGGTDSACVVELCKHMDFRGIGWAVMTIDTGLSSTGHIDKVRADMKRAKLPLSIFTGEGLDWYIENVHQYGYAYTPNQHVIYYRMLKERAIEDSIKEVKTKYHQRVLNITGVRRQESFRRKNTPFIYHSRGARVTLNLIADYSDDDKRYVLTGNDWYHGKFTEDCMCNWHCRYTNEDDMNSDMRIAVQKTDELLSSCGLWTYGQKPNKEQISMFHDVRSDIETMPTDSLCSNCERTEK